MLALLFFTFMSLTPPDRRCGSLLHVSMATGVTGPPGFFWICLFNQKQIHPNGAHRLVCLKGIFVPITNAQTSAGQPVACLQVDTDCVSAGSYDC